MENLNVALITPNYTGEEMSATFNHSIDAGSTETRSSIFHLTDSSMVSEVLEVPADYAVYESSLERIHSSSKNVADNLHFIISDITDDKVEKYFDKTQIIKGSLLDKVICQREVVTGVQSKIETTVTYTNILCSLALRAYLTSCRKEQYITEAICDLTVALRPRDTETDARCNYFFDRMAGTYEVELPRLNYKVTIVIPRDKILVDDEASLQLRYWAVTSGVNLNEVRNAVVLDCGGSSLDIGIFKNGVIYTEASDSYPYAGNNMEVLVSNRVQQEYGLSSLSKAERAEVLVNGYALNCKAYSATSAIKAAKVEMVKKILNVLNERLTVAEMQIKAVDYLLCSGRALNASGKEEFRVPSVVSMLNNQISKTSERTKVVKQNIDNPIVMGGIIYRLAQEK